jgi:hypothetical protein
MNLHARVRQSIQCVPRGLFGFATVVSVVTLMAMACTASCGRRGSNAPASASAARPNAGPYRVRQALGGVAISASMSPTRGEHVFEQWQASGTILPIAGKDPWRLLVLLSESPGQDQPVMQLQLVYEAESAGEDGFPFVRWGTCDVECDLNAVQAESVLENGLPPTLVTAIVETAEALDFRAVPRTVENLGPQARVPPARHFEPRPKSVESTRGANTERTR